MESGHIHVKNSIFKIFFLSTGGGKRYLFFDKYSICGEARLLNQEIELSIFLI